MNFSSARASTEGSGHDDALRELIHQPEPSKRSVLSWWYAHMAPPDPGPNGTFAQREVVRRGRLASMLLTFIALYMIVFVVPYGILGPNKKLIILGPVLCTILCIALWINKRGKIYIAGAIGVIAVAFALAMSVISTPGGLGAGDLPLLDVLISVELLAISLLPVPYVFVVAFVESCFIIVVFLFLPHARSLNDLIASGGLLAAIARPLTLQWLVAIALAALLNSALNALRRADRAEVIARLEHRIAQQGQQAELEKRQLEESIKSIVQVHVAVANGNFNVRVPFHEGNMLWTVAGSLNNLLNRFQRALQAEQEYQKRFQWLQSAAQNEIALQQIVRELLRDPAYVQNNARLREMVEQVQWRAQYQSHKQEGGTRQYSPSPSRPR